MCGIIGFFGFVREGQWGQTHSLLREMFVNSEHRGRDATGFAALTEPLDKPARASVVAAKEPLSAARFVAVNPVFQQLRHRRCSAFVGHVRAATHGDPLDNGNNHPFSSDDGLHLVHNGVVANYLDLADAHALKLESKCDSEVLLRLVEAGRDPLDGIETCLREVSGSMAVAVLDNKDGNIWLARNEGRPLWLARLDGDDRRWFFASERETILKSLSRVVGPQTVRRLDYLAPLPANEPVVLTGTGRLIAPGRTHSALR